MSGHYEWIDEADMIGAANKERPRQPSTISPYRTSPLLSLLVTLSEVYFEDTIWHVSLDGEVIDNPVPGDEQVRPEIQ